MKPTHILLSCLVVTVIRGNIPPIVKSMNDSCDKLCAPTRKDAPSIFIKQYVRHLTEKNSPKFLICSKFRSLLWVCPAECLDLANHWSRLQTELRCSCSTDRDDSPPTPSGIQAPNCSTRQQAENAMIKLVRKSPTGNSLFRSCSSRFEFQLKQNTGSPCVFLELLLTCQSRVFALGVTGKPLDYLLSVVTVMAHSNPKVRKYIQGCPALYHPDLPRSLGDMDNGGDVEAVSCANLDILPALDACLDDTQPTQFLDYLNLVVYGGASEVNRTCRDLNKYDKCVKKVVQRCKQKITQFDWFMKPLQHLQRLKFICQSKFKKDYTIHADYLEKAAKSNALVQCEEMWRLAVVPLSSLSMSAYRYNCPPVDRDPFVQRLKRKLFKIAACYRLVGKNKCNTCAGEVLSRMFLETVARQPVAQVFSAAQVNCGLVSSGSRRDKPASESNHWRASWLTTIVCCYVAKAMVSTTTTPTL